MNVIETHIVPEGINHVRFSDYACEVFVSIPSRKGIKNAIKRGDFLIDGVKGETGRWIEPGMKIELASSVTTKPKEYNLELQVIYDDDYLAAIIKPAGIPVNGNSFRTVENSLVQNLKQSPEKDALFWPRPVHRLDVPTGGILLIAKTLRAQVSLGDQFGKKTIKKRYRAIVQGKIEAEGCINTPIEGRDASTNYKPVRSCRSLKNEWLTLVDLIPLTGRTHQLRRHMAELGHPIAGDTLYGRKGDVFKGKGLFLAAVELAFTHPVSGDIINLEIRDPEKFAAYLEREERRWKKYRNE